MHDAHANRSSLTLLTSDGFADYRMLDSGGGRRLEKFGRVTVERPEPQAMWKPRLSAQEWAKADAVFADDADAEQGKWRVARAIPESWPLKVPLAAGRGGDDKPVVGKSGDVTMLSRLSVFRHLGIFPEQLPNWQWMFDGLARMGPKPRVLNLFAYTGCASLIAARAGAEVTHVDASRKAISWAKENQLASGLASAPVRWMLEDVRKFVAREVRRGKTYDVILVDPPKFGRGPTNEVWELDRDLPPLMADCAALLAREKSMLILTAYAIRASAIAIGQVAGEALAAHGGRFETGELAVAEHGGTRLVPTSLFTRWCANDLGL